VVIGDTPGHIKLMFNYPFHIWLDPQLKITSNHFTGNKIHFHLHLVPKLTKWKIPTSLSLLNFSLEWALEYPVSFSLGERRLVYS
jgi:hypothetical protein